MPGRFASETAMFASHLSTLITKDTELTAELRNNLSTRSLFRHSDQFDFVFSLRCID